MRAYGLITAALITAGVLAGAALPARAATEAPFTQAAFAATQQQGKPILVDITASWCPTCAKQRPILAQLVKDPAFKDLQVYTVDFDAQKDVVRAMGAQMQSTLVVFRGKDEKGRSTGDTAPASIRALLEKANS